MDAKTRNPDPNGPGPEAKAGPGGQPRNPLHGVTLEALVTALLAQYGWAGLAQRVPLRCFSHEPSVSSSLKFLRRTPWAREKVEDLYRVMQDEARAAHGSPKSGAPHGPR